MEARHRANLRVERQPQRTLQGLLIAYLLLVAYASLYPFTGWVSPAQGLWDFLRGGWPRYWTGFDVVSNALGYVPMGLLVGCVAWGPTARRHPYAWAFLCVGACALFSLSLETFQNFLLLRVPSKLDWALNSGGGLLGVAWAALLLRWGWFHALQRWRVRHWQGDTSGVSTLVVLWPAALLFPLPAPGATGRLLAPLLDSGHHLLAGSFLDPIWPQVVAAASPSGLSPLGYGVLAAVSLAAPCFLALSMAQSTLGRVLGLLWVLGMGWGMSTLSTALSVGPSHALAWITPQALSGWGVGLVAVGLCVNGPSRGLAVVALMGLVVQVTLVNQLPADGYLVQSLQSWEQGQFIRFHGLAQWLGWLWPFVAIGHAARRLARPA